MNQLTCVVIWFKWCLKYLTFFILSRISWAKQNYFVLLLGGFAGSSICIVRKWMAVVVNFLYQLQSLSIRHFYWFAEERDTRNWKTNLNSRIKRCVITDIRIVDRDAFI